MALEHPGHSGLRLKLQCALSEKLLPSTPWEEDGPGQGRKLSLPGRMELLVFNGCPLYPLQVPPSFWEQAKQCPVNDFTSPLVKRTVCEVFSFQE